MMITCQNMTGGQVSVIIYNLRSIIFSSLCFFFLPGPPLHHLGRIQSASSFVFIY